MNGKRKLTPSLVDDNCIGPLYCCPHAQRSCCRKRPRTEYTETALKSDEQGFILFKIGDIILERYEIISEIGRGGNGIVLKVEDKRRNEIVALKAVRNEKHTHHDAVNEYHMLKLIRKMDANNEHHLVHLLDGFCSGGHICLVFELVGPDLLEFMIGCRFSTMTLCEIQSIGVQLCDAVNFLHEHNLVHNDIKPGNIAFKDPSFSSKMSYELDVPLSNTDICLLDFGSLKPNIDYRSVAVTSAYRAPEFLVNLQASEPYDIWTIGCTLFELYTGEALFNVENDVYQLAMIEQVIGNVPANMIGESHFFHRGKVKIDRRTRFARQLRSHTKKLNELKRGLEIDKEDDFFDLLEKMLTIDPEKRITANEALQHSFFCDAPCKSDSSTDSCCRQENEGNDSENSN